MGDGGSLTLRHPWMPGDGLGLNRRATRGDDAFHGLGAMSGGWAPNTVTAGMALSHWLRVVDLLVTFTAEAACSLTDFSRFADGIPVASCAIAARVAIVERAAPGRLRPTRAFGTCASAAVGAAALDSRGVGGPVASATAARLSAIERIRTILLHGPQSGASVTVLLQRIKLAVLASGKLHRGRLSRAAVWAPLRRAYPAVFAVVVVSSALASSDSGALG